MSHRKPPALLATSYLLTLLLACALPASGASREECERDFKPESFRPGKDVVWVPTHDPGWNTAETLDDIPEALQREITHFFSVYKQLEGKEVEVEGWRSREEALDVIADGRKLQLERERS